MDNITIFNNFPKDIIEELNNFFDPNFPFEKWNDVMYAYGLPLEIEKPIKNKMPVYPSQIYVYKIKPGMLHAHIDRGRSAAIQIPINVANGFGTYSVKNDMKQFVEPDKTTRPGYKQGQIVSNEVKYFNYFYKKEYFDHYEGSLPYIQNTATIHGGYNKTTDTDRYFWTIGFKNISYKDLIKEFDSYI